MGVPRGALCRDLMVNPSGFNNPWEPVKMRGTSYRAIIRGVWAPPKLLAEAKSDENEQATAESLGSNTPWAYRPGELIMHHTFRVIPPQYIFDLSVF